MCKGFWIAQEFIPSCLLLLHSLTEAKKRAEGKTSNVSVAGSQFLVSLEEERFLVNTASVFFFFHSISEVGPLLELIAAARKIEEVSARQ